MTTRGKPTKEDLIYAASFIDGEGHIIISKVKRGGKYKTPTYVLVVGCTNTNKFVIDWFQTTFRASRSIRKRTRANPHWKICYSWSIEAKKAKKFLESILPYMKVKPDQAKLALEFQRGVYHRHTETGKIIKTTQEEVDRRETLYLKLKALKH